MSLSTSMCILDYNSSHMHWEVPMLSCTMFTYKVFVLVIKVSQTPSYWTLFSLFYFHVYVQNSYPYFSMDQTITLHSSSVTEYCLLMYYDSFAIFTFRQIQNVNLVDSYTLRTKKSPISLIMYTQGFNIRAQKQSSVYLSK